jgi:putative drug exporter of the RND superfamily
VTLTDPGEPSAGRGAAAWVVSRRRWIWLAWAVAAVALLPLAPRAASQLHLASGGAQASESEWVDDALRTRFGSPFANAAILVIDGVPGTDSAGAAVLREIADSVERAPVVRRIRRYFDVPDSATGATHGAFIVAGLAPDTAGTHDGIVALRAATRGLEAALRPRLPHISLDWTGSAAFDLDVQQTSAADVSTAERRVLPLTLLLLLLVFGSVAAALIPVTAGALGIGMSLGMAVLIARHWPLTVLLQNVVSMIGLGLGIDYALLMTSRFREETARGLAAHAAAVEAARHAGHTVLLSGLAVGIGFAALLLVPANELRSIAIGGMLVVGGSMLIATTLLPGVLAALGGRIELGRLWLRGASPTTNSSWRRWGRRVTAHPWIVLVAAGAPLVALGWQARRLSAELPSGPWLPAQMESMRAAAALQRMGQAGVVQAMRVVVELPATSLATSEDGWRGLYLLSRALERDPRVAQVRSLPLAWNTERPNTVLLSILPSDARTSFMSRDERLAMVELIPAERETPTELTRLVRELRRLDVPAITGIAGARIRIGGIPAMNADYKDAIGGSTLRVIALIVSCTWLALLLGFRSVLVAAKAVLLNLLSVGAAMGAAVLVFQDGHGARLLGLAAPVDGLFPAVPIIVFCVVFGLSMDYEVFLVGRIAECIDGGMPDDEALVEGLARTAGVITSAASVMILVFSGFALSDFLLVKILGFALAVAVLIDATLVRIAVGPALLRLAGRRNWWPRVRGGTRAG